MKSTRKWIAAALASMLLVAHEAMADGKLAAPVNERWKSECGSCHLAYPPGLLPAQSWRQMMSGLDKHFGADASVDAAAGAQIGAYLERHAGTGKRVQGAGKTLRITDTAWFVREHDEVPAAAWKHPAVRSAGNCAACHTAAGEGDYSERNIRMPR